MYICHICVGGQRCQIFWKLELQVAVGIEFWSLEEQYVLLTTKPDISLAITIDVLASHTTIISRLSFLKGLWFVDSTHGHE